MFVYHGLELMQVEVGQAEGLYELRVREEYFGDAGRINPAMSIMEAGYFGA